jgi:hypothetical protein
MSVLFGDYPVTIGWETAVEAKHAMEWAEAHGFRSKCFADDRSFWVAALKDIHEAVETKRPTTTKVTP